MPPNAVSVTICSSVSQPDNRANIAHRKRRGRRAPVADHIRQGFVRARSTARRRDRRPVRSASGERTWNKPGNRFERKSHARITSSSGCQESAATASYRAYHCMSACQRHGRAGQRALHVRHAAVRGNLPLQLGARLARGVVDRKRGNPGHRCVSAGTGNFRGEKRFYCQLYSRGHKRGKDAPLAQSGTGRESKSL